MEKETLVIDGFTFDYDDCPMSERFVLEVLYECYDGCYEKQEFSFETMFEGEHWYVDPPSEDKMSAGRSIDHLECLVVFDILCEKGVLADLCPYSFTDVWVNTQKPVVDKFSPNWHRLFARDILLVDCGSGIGKKGIAYDWNLVWLDKNGVRWLMRKQEFRNKFLSENPEAFTPEG